MRNGLILDTCGLIWLVSGNKRLSQSVLEAIDAAQLVFVSAISAWEISLKTVRGGLELPLSPLEWFNAAIEKHDLALYDLTPEILVAANHLPWHHNDPADRFIIATALRDNLSVVTGDSRFQAYGIEVLC